LAVEFKLDKRVIAAVAGELPLMEPDASETGERKMLRIHIDDGPEALGLSLEGSLSGPWVAELEKCWRAGASKTPARTITIELAGVTFVDDQGKELLCRMRRSGARLVPRGCLMKAIVKAIEADICRPEGESV
jgi:hypothetical protein